MLNLTIIQKNIYRYKLFNIKRFFTNFRLKNYNKKSKNTIFYINYLKYHKYAKQEVVQPVVLS